jgi:hypothetical protein
MRVGTPTQKPSTETETSNEDREHGSRRCCRRTKNQAELADPGRLVDEGAAARPEQQGRKAPSRRSHAVTSERTIGDSEVDVYSAARNCARLDTVEARLAEKRA